VGACSEHSVLTQLYVGQFGCMIRTLCADTAVHSAVLVHVPRALCADTAVHSAILVLVPNTVC
jgi:hypothetical protein